MAALSPQAPTRPIETHKPAYQETGGTSWSGTDFLGPINTGSAQCSKRDSIFQNRHDQVRLHSRVDFFYFPVGRRGPTRPIAALYLHSLIQ
ncbi:hypothetical protein Kisp01_72620 [Kineosporia sp. NBRC 101677]|nr:hypothetical protein Kisp01_72620 [Kineosporia sp. NBRC 101677]